jgi:hypothetical protein
MEARTCSTREFWIHPLKPGCLTKASQNLLHLLITGGMPSSGWLACTRFTYGINATDLDNVSIRAVGLVGAFETPTNVFIGRGTVDWEQASQLVQ